MGKEGGWEEPQDVGSSKKRSNPYVVLPDTGEMRGATTLDQAHMVNNQQWWLLVVINIILLLAGQTAAMLLGRFYYDEGGNSKWMSTLVQTAGFPILIVALFLFPKAISAPSTSNSSLSDENPSVAKLALVYLGIGLLVAGDNLMYSYGLLYLPVSTYSLVCATQLGFNAVFSYFLNAQKFTHLIFNSVVLLTFSAALLGVHSDTENSSNISHGKYALGFILTLGASATYSLILSLMQVAFQKVLKKETFSVVVDMQMYTAIVASCVATLGLFASGEWKILEGEMHAFTKGKTSYVMTLVGIALSWQIASVSVVGLIFAVSSLFSNVISTFALPVVPIFAAIFFNDKMDGVKIMALLLALWGFVSYVYQNYLDDSKRKKVLRDDADEGEP